MDISNLMSMLNNKDGGDMTKILSQLGGANNPIMSLLPQLLQNNNNQQPKPVVAQKKTPQNDKEVNFTLFKLSQEE